MRSRNDWNVPDWRDASAYPARETPAHVWAWEFLRRNPEYRRAWTAADHDDLDSVQERFGLVLWHDPRSNERGEGPFFLSRGVHRVVGESSQIFLYELAAALDDNDLARAKELVISRRSSAGRKPARDRLTYAFNLQLPLDPQFCHALEDARSVQKRRNGEFSCKKSLKVRTDKFAIYLRLLDAEENKVDLFEIAHVMFSTTSDPLVTFRNQNRAARKLRDGGYLALAGAS